VEAIENVEGREHHQRQGHVLHHLESPAPQLNDGLRFSRNALMPSRPSALPADTAMVSASSTICDSNAPSDADTRRLVRPTACWARDVSRSASLSASLIS